MSLTVLRHRWGGMLTLEIHPEECNSEWKVFEQSYGHQWKFPE